MPLLRLLYQDPVGRSVVLVEALVTRGRLVARLLEKCLRLHFRVGVRKHYLVLANPQYIAVERAHLLVEVGNLGLFDAVLEGAVSELAALRVRIQQIVFVFVDGGQLPHSPRDAQTIRIR